MFRRHFVSLLAVLTAAAAANATMSFNLSNGTELAALQSSDPTLYAQVHNGFVAAAAMWSSQLTDTVTVNITINYSNLQNSTFLGQSSHAQTYDTYSSVKSALVSHATSANDAMAIAHLPATRLSFYTNIATANPSARYLDNLNRPWNNGLTLANANAKALGLLPADDPGKDGSITFNTQFSWDFDRSNGIASGTYDFVGVAAHEIGHSLGFVSGVDTVDYYSAPKGPSPLALSQQSNIFTPLDLYRHSSTDGGNLELSTLVPSYLSVDGGTTNSGSLSTGAYNGLDTPTRQASHWQDGLGLGIMGPTIGSGKLLTISNTDLMAFDVIGYGVVPEPGIFFLALAPSMMLLRRARRAPLREVDA